ncbi:MAG: hypothetical protein HOV68_32345 [Streptomycetaceae bacterium]|nr:hypothetical protein [Streptomycetaceae bacterium]
MTSPHLATGHRPRVFDRGIAVGGPVPVLLTGALALVAAFLTAGASLRPASPFLWVAVFSVLVWVAAFGPPGRRRGTVLRHSAALAPWMRELRAQRRINLDLHAPSDAVLDDHVLPLLRAVADGEAAPEALHLRILLPGPAGAPEDEARLAAIEELIEKIRTDHPGSAFSAEIRHGTALDPYARYLIGDLLAAEGALDGPGRRAHELHAYRPDASSGAERANAAEVVRRFEADWHGGGTPG